MDLRLWSVEGGWNLAAPQMMIDLRAEKPILLRVFARTCLDEARDYDTIRKWWRRGLLNRDTGKRVKLEVVRLTNGMATTQEAYERFLMRLNGSRPIKSRSEFSNAGKSDHA